MEIERFHGPLDLLLHLIRQQDIDVLDIPIARITRQFLSAVEGIRATDLDSAGEFLEMAATLVRIKAQLLLPRPVDETEDDPRAELVRRLLEYEQIREISQRLRRTEAERARRFKKGFIALRPIPLAEEVLLETVWEEVFSAALEVRPPDLREAHRVTTKTVSMEEKVELILSALEEATSIEFRPAHSTLPRASARSHDLTCRAGTDSSARGPPASKPPLSRALGLPAGARQ